LQHVSLSIVYDPDGSTGKSSSYDERKKWKVRGKMEKKLMQIILKTRVTNESPGMLHLVHLGY